MTTFIGASNEDGSQASQLYGVPDEENVHAPSFAPKHDLIIQNESYSDEEELAEMQKATVPGRTFVSGKRMIFRFVCFAVAVIISTVVGSLPSVMPEADAARRALGLFLFVAIMWASEAVPVYATALAIPALVVMSRVILDSSGKVLPASDAAKEVMGSMFSSTVLVALGAFTMSLALGRLNISYRLARLILRMVGTRPRVILLAVMFLGLFLSMWINNVAAPVVVANLMLPSLKQLPRDETFSKVMLLGIAFSCNIGGMSTPIASPQNLVALNTFATFNLSISWGQFLAVSIPFSMMCTLITWVVLWAFYRPSLARLPQIPEREMEPWGWRHHYTLLVCATTIVLWALGSTIETYVGSPGITALLPVLAFFMVPILQKSDFKELSWDVLMLLAGGLALGDAIQSSGLLTIIANGISDVVAGQNIWVVLVAFSSFMWLCGNFVSHTVASIIVLPVLGHVACDLTPAVAAAGDVAGACDPSVFAVLVLGSALIDSGAMALPVTSFPNAQCYSMAYDDGTPFLSSSDFLKSGTVIGILELVLLWSLGFGLLDAVF